MRPVASRRRSRRVLLVITLLAVTLISIDASGSNAFDPVRNLASDAVAPLSGAVRWLTTPFRNAWTGITRYDEVKAENRELRDRLDEIQANHILETNAQEQLERLNRVLDIKFVGKIPTQVARVASGPRNNFTDHRMEIDKGADVGLRVGMPVVTKAGLVGRLTRVSGERSVVQLVTDPALVIGVRVAETQELGLGHGSGAGKPFVVDRQIELTSKVKVGDLLLTSGLGRAIMPPGVPLGTVAEIQPDEGAQSLILRVEFSAELSQLDFVQVMKWTPAP